MKFISCLILFFLFIPQVAFAKLTTNEIQDLIQEPQPKINIPGLTFSEPKVIEEGNTTYLSLPYLSEYIAQMYKFSVIAAGIIAVIMIIVGGFQITMSGGNSEAQSSAKKRITGALVGLVLAAGSYTILYTINPELVSLNNLRVQYVEKENLADFIRDFGFSGTALGEASLGTCSDSYSIPTAPTVSNGGQQFTHIGVVWNYKKGKDVIFNNLDTLDIVDIFGTEFRQGKITKGNYINNSNVAAYIKELRAKKSDIKIITGIHSIGDKSDINKLILKQNTHYPAFLKYTTDVIRAHNLDGISIDLEFPSATHQPKVNKVQVTAFYADLRKDLEKSLNKKIIINVYLLPSPRYPFDLNALSKEVDYISAMTYGVYKTEGTPKNTGPYVFAFPGKPFTEKYSVQAFTNYMKSQIDDDKKIIIALGAWPASQFNGTSSNEPGALYTSGRYNRPEYMRKQLVNKPYCLHESGAKYVQSGTTQYWFEDYETYSIKFNWLKKQQIGGIFEWSTNLMSDPQYWAAIRSNL
ncbi:hypothetical protein KKG22_00705 [Patescibacteria group bacterium]|nr:hypothetical protein [Patescibacteria group bacterium]MBU1721918.1 hypothetical protein [Patescibacteria group bacterium]MBU1901211.1 hypothetical protein [Patescibacteria group bacterium]